MNTFAFVVNLSFRRLPYTATGRHCEHYPPAKYLKQIKHLSITIHQNQLPYSNAFPATFILLLRKMTNIVATIRALDIRLSWLRVSYNSSTFNEIANIFESPSTG